MTRGVTLRPCSRTSSPTIRTLRSLESLQWQTRHGKSSKTLPSAGGSASLTSPFGAPLPVVGFHLRTTFKPLLASLYRFHVYHTTRRLLEELRDALPWDKSYSWYENAYDSRAYKRLCAEFAVPPEQDWRQKLDHGCQGLGSWSTFMTPSGAYRHAHVAQGPFFHPNDAMRHNRDISGAWTTFVLDKSEGFTQAGVERLNDSIRTYVWAILGAQAQTRSNILKTGTGFDAQRQLLADIEDVIASPVVIPSSISCYKKTRQYAYTPLDFVFGIGLYLSPSDMALHPGNIQGYNNEIQIAGSDAAIGHNPGINEAEPIASKGEKAFQRKIASPTGTVHKGPQPSQNKMRVSAADSDGTSAEKRQSATAHEEKTALVAVGVALRRFGYRLASQSRAATRSRVPTAMANAHEFSASQVAVFPNVLKSQETIEPMIPGKAAAALPAKLARARPRACRCFFHPLIVHANLKDPYISSLRMPHFKIAPISTLLATVALHSVHILKVLSWDR